MKYLVLCLNDAKDESSFDHDSYLIADDLEDVYEQVKECWAYDENPEDIFKRIRVLPLDDIHKMKIVVKKEFTPV